MKKYNTHVLYVSVERFCSGYYFLCHSKNKPPALQVEGISLDKSMNSYAKINVGLQTTNKIA